MERALNQDGFKVVLLVNLSPLASLANLLNYGASAPLRSPRVASHQYDCCSNAPQKPADATRALTKSPGSLRLSTAYGTTSLPFKAFAPATFFSILPRTFATVQASQPRNRLAAPPCISPPQHGASYGSAVVLFRLRGPCLACRLSFTLLAFACFPFAQAGSMGSSLLAGEETPGWLAVGSLLAAVRKRRPRSLLKSPFFEHGAAPQTLREGNPSNRC